MPGSSSDFHAGRKVGKYEVLTLLSMGGMAELFLAYTAGPGGFRKFVALKQILPDIKKDDAFVKMFLDEARITAAFSHSNIGQVFDLGEDQGELYLAMEFISGQNLEQVVKACRKKGQTIPVGFAALAVRDCCLALHYAHHFTEPSGKPAPVIHRDVSPKNLMVTYDGNVKVIDFGIAKAKGRLNRTQAGMVKGTGGYMSPEQVRNEPLDGRSDLFSAAVMLHELLAGARLFDGPSDAATMIQIVEGEITPPRALNPNVPEALSQVVMKALSRDREERYATGKELARAIDAAMAGQLFDEDQTAEFMRTLFADKVEKTRALLDMATRDDGELSTAAGLLREEVEVDGRAESKPGTPQPRKSGTPAPRMPRPGGTPRGAASRLPRTPRTPRAPARPIPPAQREPSDLETISGATAEAADSDSEEITPPTSGRRPQSSRTPTNRRAATPRAPAPKEKYASSVAASYALYSEQDAETEQRSPAPTSVRPKLARPEPSKNKRAWYSASFGWLFLFALVGGLTFATTRLDGAFGEWVMPGYRSAETWVRTEFAGEPPPPGPSAIRPRHPPPGPPPQQAAQLAPPQTTPAPTDGPANVADTAPGAPSDSEPKPKGVERAKNNTVAAAAHLAVKTTPQPKSTPEPERKTTTAAKVKTAAGLPATTATQAPDEVEVLDTRSASGAERDGLGWMTLYTVPPVFVFDGATKLGSTPLIKVPLPVGTYRLRLLDADSKYRTLSVPIKAGKVTDLKISVSDLPLDPVQD